MVLAMSQTPQSALEQDFELLIPDSFSKKNINCFNWSRIGG